MRNVHDVGGMVGFGPLPRDDDNGSAFDSEWEKATMGLTFAAMANGYVRSIDENRHAKERMRPEAYLESSYWELWLAALEVNLVENGAFSEEEIVGRTQEFLDDPDRPIGTNSLPELNDGLVAMIDNGASFGGDPGVPPRFAAGDAVRVVRTRTRRHTRRPLYAQGCRAVVSRVNPPFALPEVIAHEAEPVFEHTYQIRLDASEVFGPSGDASSAVYLDVFESYLEPEGDPS